MSTEVSLKEEIDTGFVAFIVSSDESTTVLFLVNFFEGRCRPCFVSCYVELVISWLYADDEDESSRVSS